MARETAALAAVFLLWLPVAEYDPAAASVKKIKGKQKKKQRELL